MMRSKLLSLMVVGMAALYVVFGFVQVRQVASQLDALQNLVQLMPMGA